jgi:multiple sugar transport system permease protein
LILQGSDNKMQKKAKSKGINNPFTGYFFITPQVLLALIFIAYPVIEGFRMSFYQSTYQKDIFVGLENYINLFKDEVFIKSIMNTLVFVIAIVTLTIIFGIFVAASVYDKGSKYISFIRACYYLPVMVSMVIMSMVWNFLLNPANGLINYFFQIFGVHNVNLLGDKNYVIPIIIFVTFVGNVGQAIILYIASMIGVPQDYFEAAQIDGATRWERIKHILIPLVKPTTLYLIVINVIAVLKIFVVIQLLTDGGPNNASVTMMYYLYQNAFVYNRMGEAAAVGVIMFILAIIFAIPQFKTFRSNS